MILFGNGQTGQKIIKSKACVGHNLHKMKLPYIQMLMVFDNHPKDTMTFDSSITELATFDELLYVLSR